MKNRNSKLLLPIGVSVLAMMAMGSASAQEAGSPYAPAANLLEQNMPDLELQPLPDLPIEREGSVLELMEPPAVEAEVPPASPEPVPPPPETGLPDPALPDVPPVIDDVTPSNSAAEPASDSEVTATEPAAERVLDESVDPYVADEVRQLDALGVIGAQSRIGEDILIIDREISRADAVKRLISYMGLDAFRLKYPDLAESMANSPVMLEAEANHYTLLHKIEEAKRGPEKKEEAKPPTARDDGSSFFDATHVGAPAAGDGQEAGGPVTPSPELVALIAAEVKKATEEAEKARAAEEERSGRATRNSLTLLGIYGSGGELVANISLGDERFDVRAGQVLSKELEINEITQDAITITRDGTRVTINING